MRIKPKTNKLLIEVRNATTMTKFKLPRKQKKEFIKLYGRKEYNSIMIRVQMKHDMTMKIRNAMKGVKKSFASFGVACKNTLFAIQKINSYNNDLAEKIRKNIALNNCEAQENQYGFLLNFKE